MSTLEKATSRLREMETRCQDADDGIRPLDARVGVIVSVLYLVMMLSVGVGRLSVLLWFALYPIVACGWLGISFGKVLRDSLVVLPLVICIGIFNPYFDRKVAMTIGGVAVSEGWISFISIVLRGLLAMQCVLILISTGGFVGLCRGLRRLGVPRFLTDQLLFVYRYLNVLLQEALTMRRARESRGFGKKRFPLKLWGVMIGQLLLRTLGRSERISQAMLARGFDGTLPDLHTGRSRLHRADIVFLIVWCVALPLLRFLPLSALFGAR